MDAGSRRSSGAGKGGEADRPKSVKAQRLEALLLRPVVALDELKTQLWSGVPEDASPWIRSEAWQLTLGYIPPNRERRRAMADRKRQEYLELRRVYYDRESMHSETDTKVLRQIRVDLPRTSPGGYGSLFLHPRIQKLMERALYVWAVRHPASGYVQGINDIITPIVLVFLRSIRKEGAPDGVGDVDQLEDEDLDRVEADSYWCLSKIISQIQDNYTFGQPGIQRLVRRLSELVTRVDEPLFKHITSKNGIDFMQFAFRWMNCLLVREFPLNAVVRLWDSYIAEELGFSTFHVYVCTVFLLHWSNELRGQDFQEMMLFIQKFPTSTWTSKEIESLVAEAFVLKSLFHGSPKHLEMS